MRSAAKFNNLLKSELATIWTEIGFASKSKNCSANWTLTDYNKTLSNSLTTSSLGPLR